VLFGVSEIAQRQIGLTQVLMRGAVAHDLPSAFEGIPLRLLSCR
jgi:hypothetical protein